MVRCNGKARKRMMVEGEAMVPIIAAFVAANRGVNQVKTAGPSTLEKQPSTQRHAHLERKYARTSACKAALVSESSGIAILHNCMHPCAIVSPETARKPVGVDSSGFSGFAE